ncbi:MAG: Lipid A export ATP-binding/permease protein MsbA [Candidatus Ozemobacter sibiricus]|uniref:Lipid A export ATP-binding/permease protein MsbA n=1 Tax=Candidatus Ozemobacter sibiricus TaxID=2268124 RepID=A0A367ZTB2_9BACT|nr:MAG: Lipid A export ATP-binding/permease protein MsbA [Candidatus Ozemobacter sibiricus]
MNTLFRILGYFRPYLWYLGVALFFSFVQAVCTIYPAWIMKSVINDVLVQRDLQMLHYIAWTLVVVMGIKGVANFIQTYLMTWVAQDILRVMRSACFDRLIQLSLSYFEKQRTGQLMSRITSDVLVLQHLLSSSTGLVGDLIAFVGFCLYIFYLHWKLAFISIIIIPIIGALINKFSRKMKKIGTRMQSRIGDIATVLQEVITGVKVVKSFTLEELVRARFEKANEENFRETMKGNRINAATSPVIEFINTVGLAIIFWYGGYEVIQGRLDAGQLISFLTALVGLFTPIKNLSKLSNVISQSVGAGERVFEILDAPVEIQDRPGAVPLAECRGKVDYEGVVFSYNGRDPVLNGVTLSVEPGEIVALVGPSGAGKTTFVNLLPRFFDIQAGSIRIDGRDVRDLTLASLRRHIGLVPQEILLFSGTIADNIRLGRLDATDAEVEAAARLANAHEFILAQPKGYQTELGERGVNLSGGQGQRLALARAFLKDPRILILDEATSALDSETENLIRESLARLMKNRTTFIIAHRLSTVVNADKIVVLQHGRIVESGPHARLLEQNGLYAHLYHSQYSNQLAVGLR